MKIIKLRNKEELKIIIESLRFFTENYALHGITIEYVEFIERLLNEFETYKSGVILDKYIIVVYRELIKEWKEKAKENEIRNKKPNPENKFVQNSSFARK